MLITQNCLNGVDEYPFSVQKAVDAENNLVTFAIPRVRLKLPPLLQMYISDSSSLDLYILICFSVNGTHP